MRILLVKGRAEMERINKWLIGAAVVGTTASLVAVGLLWFLVTHPIAVAQVLARGL
jgi:putative flippase GtrA